ncbi:MAG: sulfotransferase [Bacteroidia bacterium]
MAVNDHSYIIIGGSTKSATSSLYVYLADHPLISRSRFKESRFFWDGDYLLAKKEVNYHDGVERYDQIFDDRPNAKFRLEATPDYLYSENTAKLIKGKLKDVRLIFILREPVDRVKSWYKFSKQLNQIAADVTIDEYIHDQLNSKEENPPQFKRAVEQGRYGFYLKKYVELFGKEKVKILSYENLSSNPGEVMNEVCSFLDIDAAFYNNYDFKIINQSFNVKNAGSYNKYRLFKRSMRRTFKNILPEFMKKPFSKVFKSIDDTYVKSASSDWDEIKISDAVLTKLNEYYKEDKQILNGLK